MGLEVDITGRTTFARAGEHGVVGRCTRDGGITLTNVDSGGEYRGALLGESLQLGAVIEIPLSVHRVSRTAAGDTDAGQPEDWTSIEFSVKADKTEALASALSKALLRDGGWYCNFNSDDEVVVVFHDRIFRYPVGDQAARAEVEQYARDMGVPESQLDWTGPTMTTE